MPLQAEIIPFWGIRDPFSMLSHSAGALLAVLGMIMLLRRAIAHELSWRACLVVLVYAGSLFITFTASALFHYFPSSARELVFFKKLDHAAIFILIAGTCTVLLNAACADRSRELIAACWIVSIAALIVKMTFWPMALWTSAAVYLAVGWTGAASVLKAMRQVSWDDLRLLVGGMFVYSLAAVVFATEAPVVWPGVIEGHELFHVMTIAGAAMHFQFVYEYCAVPTSEPIAPSPAINPVSLTADPRGN